MTPDSGVGVVKHPQRYLGRMPRYGVSPVVPPRSTATACSGRSRAANEPGERIAMLKLLSQAIISAALLAAMAPAYASYSHRATGDGAPP